MHSTAYKNGVIAAEIPARWESSKWLIYTALSLLFAGFTGLCAQLRFYLPFTPVPVTGQVFAVLLSGLLLGKKYGPLSQFFYLTLGLAGVPWFVVGPIGPTGGYMVGFIVAPYLTGELFERARIKNSSRHVENLSRQKTSPVPYTTTLAILMTGVALIYMLGLIQFSIYTQTGLIRSIRYAVLPFIPFDAAKAALAAAAARVIAR